MSNQLLNEDMSARLLNYRKLVVDLAKQQFKGLSDQKKEVIKGILEDMLKPIDNTVGGNITEDLIRNFGDQGFKVEIVAYAKPFVKVDANNPYRYVINKVSWTDGPNVMQVHFYLNDKFPKFMKDAEYNPKSYHRKISNVESRLIQTYKPLDIRGEQFAPIEVYISQVIYRENGKVADVKYIIQPTDKTLQYTDIKNNTVNALDTVEASTLAEALQMLQASIESCYYSQRYSPKYKVMSKKVLRGQESSSTNPDFSGDQVDDGNNSSDIDDSSGGSNEDLDDGGSNGSNDDQDGEVLVEQEEVTESDPMLEDSASINDT